MAKVIVFGDSMSDPATYTGVPDKTWPRQMAERVFSHEVVGNYATGGAVSGAEDDYVYEIDGVTLEANGLLGQVSDYVLLSEFIEVDVFVIWIGTNDLVIASQLDPFTRPDGLVVTATKRVINDRIALNLSDEDYYKFIIDQYTVKNINEAAQTLSPFGEVIVVGPFDLGKADVAAKKPALATAASMYLHTQLAADVTLIDMSVTTVDAIHFDHAAQKEVLDMIVAR